MNTSFFCYEEGQHFVLPPAMNVFFQTGQGVVRSDFFLADWEACTGERLVRVQYPGEADFILFPYDIGWLVDALGSAEAMNFLRNLPFFAQYEQRHVLVDHSDSQDIVETTAILFKVSVPHGFERENVVQIWYKLPAHVATSGYTFSLERIRYDVSFVGTNTNRLRKLVIAMLEREKRLKTYFDLVEAEVRDGYFFASAPNSSGVDRRALFRRVALESLTILCMPGIGPLSVRFFETLFFGRIPVLLQEVGKLPMQEVIPYDTFCIFVSRHDLQNIGAVLWSRLQERRHELTTMCAEACATWHRHFSDSALHGHMCRAVLGAVRCKR